MEIVLLVVLLAGFAGQFLYFRSSLKRQLEKPSVLATVEKEVDALITELNQNADRNLTLMEERLGQLQKLVAEADKRILLLKKDNEKIKTPVRVYTHLEKSKQISLGETERFPESADTEGSLPARRKPEEEDPYSRNSPGTPGVSGVPGVSGGMAFETSVPPGRSENSENSLPKTSQPEVILPVKIPSTREKVLSMTREGALPPAIAKTLGITLGEVELIQSLGSQK